MNWKNLEPLETLISDWKTLKAIGKIDLSLENIGNYCKTWFKMGSGKKVWMEKGLSGKS